MALTACGATRFRRAAGGRVRRAENHDQWRAGRDSIARGVKSDSIVPSMPVVHQNLCTEDVVTICKILHRNELRHRRKGRACSGFT
jgi:hypothetical protein